jgi:hypothetical protein
MSEEKVDAPEAIKSLLGDQEFMRGMKMMADMNEKPVGVLFKNDSIAVSQMSPFPAGANPYAHDSYRMGSSIGNVTIMYENHDSNHYMILVFPNGDRIRLDYAKELLDDGKEPKSEVKD